MGSTHANFAYAGNLPLVDSQVVSCFLGQVQLSDSSPEKVSFEFSLSDKVDSNSPGQP